MDTNQTVIEPDQHLSFLILRMFFIFLNIITILYNIQVYM